MLAGMANNLLAHCLAGNLLACSSLAACLMATFSCDLGEYREVFSQLEASPFLFRFFIVSLPFLFRFVTVSLPFLYRFFSVSFADRFFSVSTVFVLSVSFHIFAVQCCYH